MIKILKTAAFIIAYLLIYMLFMLLCQLVIGFTVGGFGGELGNLFPRMATLEEADIRQAVSAVADRMTAYIVKNSGPIMAISALVSLLFFSMIYKARKLDLPSVARINKRPAGIDIMYGLFAGASVSFVIGLLVQLFNFTEIFEEAYMQYDTHVTLTLGSGGALPAFIGIGLIAPVVEEIMFRGMITNELNGVMPARAAIITQGIVFGLYHLVPFQIGYTIPLGIYFGFIAYKTGSVWISAAAHVAMNSLSVLMMVPSFMRTIETVPTAALLYAGGSVFMFICSLVYFIKRERTDT